jgi:DNA polymerase-3 subunit delta
MQQLKKMIKEKNIAGVILLYGEEQFIIDTYLQRIIAVSLENGEVSMNLDIFNDPSTDIEKVINGIDTLPFMADKRVTVVKNLDLFKPKKSNSAGKLVEAIEKLPETTVLLIIEKEVDKRTKLFKTIKKTGYVVEFGQLSQSEIIDYIAKQLGKNNIRIDKSTASYFIQTVGYNLYSVNNELEKLVHYVGEGQVVTKEDIGEICTKSIENKIFELVECIGSKNRGKAIKLYNDLITLREPSGRILYMLTRQFRLNLQTKLLLEQGQSYSEIAKTIKLPPFVAKKCMSQSNNFSKEQLFGALKACLDLETSIKTGRMDPVTGIELLIIENCY